MPENGCAISAAPGRRRRPKAGASSVKPASFSWPVSPPVAAGDRRWAPPRLKPTSFPGVRTPPSPYAQNRPGPKRAGSVLTERAGCAKWLRHFRGTGCAGVEPGRRGRPKVGASEAEAHFLPWGSNPALSLRTRSARPEAGRVDLDGEGGIRTRGEICIPRRFSKAVPSAARSPLQVLVVRSGRAGPIADGWTRTSDPGLMNPLLYRLSYVGPVRHGTRARAVVNAGPGGAARRGRSLRHEHGRSAGGAGVRGGGTSGDRRGGGLPRRARGGSGLHRGLR